MLDSFCYYTWWRTRALPPSPPLPPPLPLSPARKVATREGASMGPARATTAGWASSVSTARAGSSKCIQCVGSIPRMASILCASLHILHCLLCSPCSPLSVGSSVFSMFLPGLCASVNSCVVLCGHVIKRPLVQVVTCLYLRAAGRGSGT